MNGRRAAQLRAHGMLPAAVGAALALALAGCTGPLATTPTPSPTLITPSYAPFTPDANPTQAAAGAYATPSTGGVRLAPTGSGPLTGKVIAVDPGHNGKFIASVNNKTIEYYGAGGRPCQQTGTTAFDKKTAESAMTWDIGTRTAEVMRAQGATVILTRPNNTGTGPCNDERARIANGNNADLLISIHGDGNPNMTTRGFFAEWSNRMMGGQVMSEASKAAAGDIVSQLKLHTTLPISNLSPDGVKEESKVLGVLNTATVPAVLVEVGNIIHADDWAVLGTDGGRQAVAEGLAAGAVDATSRPKPKPTPPK